MEISFLVSTDTIVIVSVQFILMMFFIYLGIKVSFFRKVSRDSEESNSIVINRDIYSYGFAACIFFWNVGKQI
ncbi:MAG: hypothetical protein IPL16_12075 [Ignavibacteria bacterium]|nr:hypothetical protein [Ignavibacteria bacterium]